VGAEGPKRNFSMEGIEIFYFGRASFGRERVWRSAAGVDARPTGPA